MSHAAFLIFDFPPLTSIFAALLFGVLSAVLLGAIETLAAIFLFRLRTVATQLFAVALALRLAVGMRDPSNRLELEGFIMTVAVLLYAIRLRRRGVLS